jgi:hypothetical protein
MMVYKTTGFFGLFPSSGILENTTFRKMDLFPTTGEGGEDTNSVGPLRKGLRLALSKGPTRVGVSPSPEDGNRSSFRNVVFPIL